MKHIARFVVKRRKLILVIAVALLIPSIIGAVATRINYDILTYLPSDLESVIGEQSLEKDFNIASTGMVTVEGMPTAELLTLKDQIAAVPGVPLDEGQPQPEGGVYLFEGTGGGGFAPYNLFGSGGALPINIKAADLNGLKIKPGCRHQTAFHMVRRADKQKFCLGIFFS